MKKIPSPQNLKEKKSRHFECMLSLPIGNLKGTCREQRKIFKNPPPAGPPSKKL
jgi:hypothetical protein